MNRRTAAVILGGVDKAKNELLAVVSEVSEGVNSLNKEGQSPDLAAAAATLEAGKQVVEAHAKPDVQPVAKPDVQPVAQA